MATTPVPYNLALQGGGAHGAFTWGVLDRLLQEKGLSIEGITGTSAGAMNATVLASGQMRGGAEGAREALDTFWRKIAELGRFSPYQRTLMDRFARNWSLDNAPAFVWMDMVSRIASPYQINPFNLNPLRSMLEGLIDFDALRAEGCIRLFLGATNVRTGKIKIFRNDEIGPDALLASACLPFLFQTVEVGGEAYWDGGYMGNPALFPLFYDCASPDILIVPVNPVHREEVPTTARGILNRVNEISFNSTLMREMRAIHFVTKLIDEGKLDPKDYTRVRLHRITGEAELAAVTSSSKLNTEWSFLEHLRDLGRDKADAWLTQNRLEIGRTGTVDLEKTFL